MPATIIVPGGGEFKRYKVPENKNSVETCSPSPECSQSSFLTASMVTPFQSQDSLTSKPPKEVDIYSDSSLIFIPSQDNKPKRTTSSKKGPKVDGSTNVTGMCDGETGCYQTTKDHKADTEKGEGPLGETSKNAPKFVFGSTDIRYRDSEKTKKETPRAQKASREVSHYVM